MSQGIQERKRAKALWLVYMYVLLDPFSPFPVSCSAASVDCETFFRIINFGEDEFYLCNKNKKLSSPTTTT